MVFNAIWLDDERLVADLLNFCEPIDRRNTELILSKHNSTRVKSTKSEEGVDQGARNSGCLGTDAAVFPRRVDPA